MKTVMVGTIINGVKSIQTEKEWREKNEFNVLTNVIRLLENNMTKPTIFRVLNYLNTYFKRS